MKFDVDCVYRFLISNKFVFTVRSYEAKAKYRTFVKGIGPATVHRRKSKVESKQDLLPYVKHSGFNNVDEWWSAIERFCKGKSKYLYLVVLDCYYY